MNFDPTEILSVSGNVLYLYSAASIKGSPTFTLLSGPGNILTMSETLLSYDNVVIGNTYNFTLQATGGLFVGITGTVTSLTGKDLTPYTFPSKTILYMIAVS